MKSVALTLDGQTASMGPITLSKTHALHANGYIPGNRIPSAPVSNINIRPTISDNTGLFAATRIATPCGARRIDALVAGDLVLDANGHTAIVSHIVHMSAPRNVFILRAPYYGLNNDVVMASEQTIVVTSDIAEYLFGEDTVIVPVWALNDGRKVKHFEARSSDRMYQLELDTCGPLLIGKCAVTALPKGRATQGRILSVSEARCFAAEHHSGFCN